MTKARYILLILLSIRKLRDICTICNVSYKFVYSIAKNKDINPSYNLMKSLSPVIDQSFWFEDVDESFISLYSNIKSQYLKERTVNKETDITAYFKN